MGDRTWVSVSVTVPAHNSLSALEDAMFKGVCEGEVMRSSYDIDLSRRIEDEGTYGGFNHGVAMQHYNYGASEVPLGDMAVAAQSAVDLMRAGEMPKRSFAAEEDGYDGGDLGWRFEYDAETDRVVEGSAAGGQFQIGLDDLIRWYNDHNRSGNALMRMVVKQFNVKLKWPDRSPVIALIERINQEHI